MVSFLAGQDFMHHVKCRDVVRQSFKAELFDKFAKEVKEKVKLDIRAIGTVRLEQAYAVWTEPLGLDNQS
jgi:hypothetical protein